MRREDVTECKDSVRGEDQAMTRRNTRIPSNSRRRMLSAHYSQDQDQPTVMEVSKDRQLGGLEGRGAARVSAVRSCKVWLKEEEAVKYKAA